MARKSKKKPSFFKVLSSMNFTKLLRLPPAFLRRNELDLSENVMIRAAYSRRKWNVKVEQMENNGLFCFTDGWPKFVEDAALKLGEFLVFFLIGKSEFEVVIYETSRCERDIPHPPASSLQNLNAHGSYVKRETDVVGREFGSENRKKGLLYFEKHLKFYHKWIFYLSVEFAKVARMIGGKHVRVEYVLTHNFQTVVENGPHKYRFDLTKGRARF